MKTCLERCANFKETVTVVEGERKLEIDCAEGLPISFKRIFYKVPCAFYKEEKPIPVREQS
jgi:hypothetical protein